MINIYLKQAGHFSGKSLVGLPIGYRVENGKRTYKDPSIIELYKNESLILRVTNKSIDYRAIKLVGDKRNGDKYTGRTHKYFNEENEIEFHLLPLNQCIFFSQEPHVVAYINGKRGILARSDKGSAGLVHRSLKCSCSRNLFDITNNKEIAMIMAIISWWVLYEQNNN